MKTTKGNDMIETIVTPVRASTTENRGDYWTTEVEIQDMPNGYSYEVVKSYLSQVEGVRGQYIGQTSTCICTPDA